jgi:putative hemolysin
MTPILIETLILLILIAANGVLAMAEIAVVSARPVRLGQRAQAGDRGARAALELARHPERFLSTVQIGITLVGILAGAFAGATLADELAGQLAVLPAVAPYAETLAVSVVVLAITYLSLVIGELVPKQVALADPERVAARIAPAMTRLAQWSGPLVNLLAVSTRTVVRLLGVHVSTEPAITPEEIRALVIQGAQAGVFGATHQAVLDRAIRLGDRRAGSLMTPRHEIAWLEVGAKPAALAQAVSAAPHAHFPVARGDLDDVVGVVHAKDLLTQALAGGPLQLAAVVREPLFVPEGLGAFELLERLRASGQTVALVMDEFGGIAGLVSVDDVATALMGAIAVLQSPEAEAVVRRPDGSWLVDGALAADELKGLLGIDELPDEGQYDTVSGLCMALARRIPATGDRLAWADWRLEIVDMDGRRVDKVILWPPGTA